MCMGNDCKMADEIFSKHMRSWYFSREEIENNSPSRRDGIDLKKESELRMIYCLFIRDVSMKLRLPQITIATAMMLCHRFYLHQSHVKNEWQTVATVCVFLASKVEDTPCPLDRVVVVAYETMYRKDPVAAHRIYQKDIFEKQKALIMIGEKLLLSTTRFDFNIQHPYEPLLIALKKLGITQKEVKQVAVNLVNDTLRTTLCVQFKPHYIAAGSLFLAAKFHSIRLPSEKGKVWWHEFDIAPKQLQAVIQQMTELLTERNPGFVCNVVKSSQTPVEKQQILSSPDSVLRHPCSSRRSLTSDLDREAARHMPLDNSLHHSSTSSSSNDEEHQSQPGHDDNSLNSIAVDERSRKELVQATMKTNHVRNGHEEIDVMRIRDLIKHRKRIREVQNHADPIDECDEDAWIERELESGIILRVESSCKKRKV